jgi:hypothetical protein
VLSKVLDFFEPAPPPLWPQATSSDEARTTKIHVFIDLIIIYDFLSFYLLLTIFLKTNFKTFYYGLKSLLDQLI